MLLVARIDARRGDIRPISLVQCCLMSNLQCQTMGSINLVVCRRGFASSYHWYSHHWRSLADQRASSWLQSFHSHHQQQTQVVLQLARIQLWNNNAHIQSPTNMIADGPFAVIMSRPRNHRCLSWLAIMISCAKLLSNNTNPSSWFFFTMSSLKLWNNCPLESVLQATSRTYPNWDN